MNDHYAVSGPTAKAALTAAAIICVGLLCLIAKPFIPALVWASSLAVMFGPVERRVRRKTRSPVLAALVTVLLAAIVVVIAILYVAAALMGEVAAGAQSIGTALSPAGLEQLKHDYPDASAALLNVAARLDLARLLQAFTLQLGTWGGQLVELSLSGVITFLLTFYFLFYLLRDREKTLQGLARAIPLSAREFQELVARTGQIVFASAYATAAVAALQGILGGLMFWFLGLPSPVFWGVIMGLLAIVPFLGAFIIWLPAAIMLAISGQWIPALVLVAWGTIVVGLIDNFLYPILVGKRLSLHPMISFVAIVGGLLLFGAHGIVLGPVIVAVTQALLPIWRSRFDEIGQGSPPAA